MIIKLIRKFTSYLNTQTGRLVLIAAVIFLFLIGGFIFTTKEKYDNKLAGQFLEIESQNLIERVSQIIYLPENEIPTIATVTDLSALKGQIFFVDAKIGDKILIYTKAKKAILYNPSSNKIVTMASLAIDNKNLLQY